MKKKLMVMSAFRFFLFIAIGLVFIIGLPLLIIGEMSNNSINNSEFNIEPNNIIFNQQNNGGPVVKLYLSKTDKVEEIYLEEYVRGVIAAEMPAEFDIEALKAQAVAARTFAIAHIETYGGNSCTQAKGGNLCDTTHCQAYMTKDERINLWPKNKSGFYWNKITAAVQETSGEILNYKGQLVKEPYYFAVSSGQTESAVDVFATDLPYLKSVSSIGDSASPTYKSTVKFSLDDFKTKINSKYPKAGISISKIHDQIGVKGGRTQGGSVKEVILGGVNISGVEFRSLLSLNSSDFTISINKENVIINCIGYGHNVGMSQWGANAMAKLGKKYSEILMHYYQGVSINKLSY